MDAAQLMESHESTGARWPIGLLMCAVCTVSFGSMLVPIKRCDVGDGALSRMRL